MSNVRKRNIKSSFKDENKQQTSIMKKVQFAVNDMIFSKKSSRNVQRIQDMQILPYIIGFSLFFLFSYFFVDYLHTMHDHTMASYQDEYTRLFIKIPCSADYGVKFKSCLPKQCGRVIRDHLVDINDINHLRSLAERGMHHGGGSGGATILDLHSGALSFKDKFINIYKLKEKIFSEKDFEIYSKVKNQILETIRKEFKIETNKLFLTKPTFFSRMNNKSAVTQHDEYWHPHVDRVNYGTFYYTSLLYLSNYGNDFTGGRFMFVDKHGNSSVEPKMGRLSFFTSGSENNHFVEKVESGTRFALTVPFTCDQKHAIPDPQI